MSWPDLAELLPQKGPMRLLSEVLAHDVDETLCAAQVSDAGLFHDADGGVPAWLALEYAAQCMAVHGALASRARGEPPRPALLLGTRRLRLSVARFPSESALRVRARHHRGESGLVAFDCSIEDRSDGAVLASGRVNVYTLDEADGPGTGSSRRSGRLGVDRA